MNKTLLAMSWTGTLITNAINFLAHLSVVLGVLCGIASLIASVTVIMLNIKRIKRKDDADRKNAGFTRSSLLLLLILPAFVLTGCNAIDSLYDKQVVEVPGRIIGTNTTLATNLVMVSATNTVTIVDPATGQISSTNIVSSVPTFVVVPQISYAYGPPSYVTNFVDKPLATTVISGVEAVPLPYAGLAGILLGWLYTGYRLLRNKKISTALVTGIEAGRKILNETPEGQKLDAKVKDVLISHQEWAGVLNEVGKIVNNYTGDTKQ